MNTVHGPIFSDAEVNPAANLTYSENRLVDIHGNTREPFEGSIFYLGDWGMNSWYNFLCEDMPFSSMPAKITVVVGLTEYPGKDVRIYSFASCILKL